MKKQSALCCLLLLAMYSQAQRSKDEQLEDSIFSWKGLPELKVAGYARTFSPVQLKHPRLFAQWLQESYIPVGALDFSYAIAEPNKKDEVQPYGTGINAAMWRPEWNSKGSMVVKQPHTENPIWMLTNYLIDAEPIPMLTVAGRAVFMRRSPDREKTFMNESLTGQNRTELIKQLQLEKHPQIGKYTIQYYGCTVDGCPPLVAVYLAPGNKLPIRQLTRGEVLDMIEQAIPAETVKAKNKIKSENSYRMDQQQKWLKHFDEETLPRWKANIQKLRDKNGQSMNAPAAITNVNGIAMINIFNGDELFAGEQQAQKLNTYGVYTYEEGVLEKSKRDQPLWVCIGWKPAGIQDMPYQREAHRSMITHFNFDYVYNYFFDPEKVKGVNYSILNAAQQKERIAAIKEQKKNSLVSTVAAGVYFHDSFSAGAAGEKPKGWYMPAVGRPSLIAVPGGEKNNWLQLGQHPITPVMQQKKLPANFTMDFDVLCGPFTGSSGGALLLNINNKVITSNGDLTDAPNPVNIDLDMKAGNAAFTANPAGYIRLKVTYKGMNSQLRYADVLQYSNDFSSVKNKVHISITREGNKVRAFVDGKEIMAIDKYGKSIPGFNELPDGARFSTFYLRNITNGNVNNIYISNICIRER